MTVAKGRKTRERCFPSRLRVHYTRWVTSTTDVISGKILWNTTLRRKYCHYCDLQTWRKTQDNVCVESRTRRRAPGKPSHLVLRHNRESNARAGRLENQVSYKPSTLHLFTSCPLYWQWMHNCNCNICVYSWRNCANLVNNLPAT